MITPKEPDCSIKTPPGHPDHAEELLDEAITETFPASDPVSISIDKPQDDDGRRNRRPAPSEGRIDL